MEKLESLQVTLELLLKNGTRKKVIFKDVSDLYIDYNKNILSLFDADAGVDYKYHFREIGDEKEDQAIEVLSIETFKY